MRKLFAIIFTVITLLALKETIYIFKSTDAAIVAKKSQLGIAGISISLPLLILSLWLWKPKN
jgi:hypothetical protein